MDTQALVALAQFLLPTGPGPSLKHPTDLIALFIHAIQVAVNFRLDPPANNQQSEPQDDKEGENDDTVSESDTAVGDDENDASPPPFPASLGISLEQALQSRLPRDWNSRGEDSYTFSYRHAQSSMGFVVKAGKIGGRVSVMGMVEVSLFSFSRFLWLTVRRRENRIRSRSYSQSMLWRTLCRGRERMSRRLVSGH